MFGHGTRSDPDSRELLGAQVPDYGAHAVVRSRASLLSYPDSSLGNIYVIVNGDDVLRLYLKELRYLDEAFALVVHEGRGLNDDDIFA